MTSGATQRAGKTFRLKINSSLFWCTKHLLAVPCCILKFKTANCQQNDSQKRNCDLFVSYLFKRMEYKCRKCFIEFKEFNFRRRILFEWFVWHFCDVWLWRFNFVKNWTSDRAWRRDAPRWIELEKFGIKKDVLRWKFWK